MPNLIKENMYCAIAQSIYREIQSRSGKYYYYLGGTSDDVQQINNSILSERQIRDNIVLLKAVNPTDVALVIDRVDWIAGTIYDKYDDAYSSSIVGVDLIDPGYAYDSIPNVTFTSTSGGTGAAGRVILDNSGSIKEVVMTSVGKGYSKNTTTVSFTGANVNVVNGREAIGKAVVNRTISGSDKIEDAKFYVMTEEHRVYKCIDNNNNSPSTVKPISTGADIFETSDGYKWKFLYRIPPTLINKFVTPDYIPVINALSDNFYDVGTISQINIDSGGTGYSPGDTKVVVIGDGYLQSNPLLIKSAVIENSGSDYSLSSTIVFDPPISGGYKNFSPSMVVSVGDVVKAGNLFYKIIKAGTLSTTPPTYTVPVIQQISGTAIIEFVGENLQANLTVTSGQITDISLLGRIYAIDIISGGSGYKDGTLPLIVKAGSTTIATGLASCLDGKVQRVMLTSNSNIIDFNTITSYEIGYKFTPGTIYSANEHVFCENNLYLTEMETSSATNLTHTNGTVNGFRYVGSVSNVQARMQYGYGYSSVPAYTIMPELLGTGASIILNTESSSAIVYPIIDSGSIVDYTVIDGGIGYTEARLEIVSGSGTGAKMSANVFVGSIDTLEANNQLSNIVGGIHTVQVVSRGANFNQAEGIPSVSVVGDGEDASVSLVIFTDPDSNGSGSVDEGENQTERIHKVRINNPGKNYTYASFTISDSVAGKGGKLRAIISPYGGHGRDNIKELFARKVMTYAKLQKETFSGFNINNDYRIYGLIKNPKNFNDTAYISSAVATGAYIVYCNYDSTKFIKDSIITLVGNSSKTFNIVDTVSGAMIIQDLNNHSIAVGDRLEISIGGIKHTTEILGFVSPSFGKYSGEILNINYRTSGFSSSNEQSIVIRSIIGMSEQD